MAAGRYVDRSIGRDVTFSIGDGWLSNGAIEGAGFALIREDADWEAFLAESMGVLESLEISPLAS